MQDIDKSSGKPDDGVRLQQGTSASRTLIGPVLPVAEVSKPITGLRRPPTVEARPEKSHREAQLRAGIEYLGVAASQPIAKDRLPKSGSGDGWCLIAVTTERRRH